MRSTGNRTLGLLLFASFLFSPALAAAQDTGVAPLRPDVGSFSLTPFIGGAFGGDLDNASRQFGAALGYGANDRISLEGEFFVLPSATQGTLRIFDTNVWSVSGNVVYHFLQEEFTPYGTIGLGVVGSDPDIPDSLLPAEDNAKTTLAFNLGIGAKAALNDRLGLRVDFRHFNAQQLAPDSWRVYAGLIIRRLGE